MLKLRTALALSLRHLRRRQISRKDRLTVFLGGVIVLMGCVPEMFSKTKMVDAFLLVSVPMTEWTYAYMVCCGVSWIVAMIIIVRCVSCSIKPFFRMLLAYAVYDFILFFVNYNSVNYYYIPLIIIAFICNKVYS